MTPSWRGSLRAATRAPNAKDSYSWELDGSWLSPIKYLSIPRAASRPSQIAHTTSDWPRRINGVQGTTVNGVTTFKGGKASTYDLPGHVTSSGEPFDRHSFTAAMRKPIPLGTFAEVSYQRPGESITRRAVVRINDRGPYVSGRIIDLPRDVMKFLTGHEFDLVPVTVKLPVPPE